MKKIKNNNVTVNKEANMENVNTTNATENAAPAADQNEAQNVPTPPANEQVTEAEKPKKKGLIKKILMIIGAILALITGGFIARRVTGNKSDDYIPDESGDDTQTTDF